MYMQGVTAWAGGCTQYACHSHWLHCLAVSPTMYKVATTMYMLGCAGWGPVRSFARHCAVLSTITFPAIRPLHRHVARFLWEPPRAPRGTMVSTWFLRLAPMPFGGCRRVHVSSRVVLNTRVRDEAPWEPRFRRSLPFVAVPFQTKDCQMEGVQEVHSRCLVCIQVVCLVCI